MIVTIFRSRLRPEHVAEYGLIAAKMNALVRTMPGYVSHKTFTAEDGERVTIVAFETMESHLAWAEHPHHREAQRAGMARLYSEYRIEVCEVARSYAGPP